MADTVRNALSMLELERNAIVAAAGPLRRERDELRAQIQPLEDRERALNVALKELEQPRLAELEAAIRAVKGAVGPVLVAEPGSIAAAPSG